MKNYFILICILIPFLSCLNQKKIVESNKIPIKVQEIELKLAKEVKQGSVILIEVVNHSEIPITVYGPAVKMIEKFENGDWRRVRILICPCGANCIAPPQTLILQPNEKYEFDWNLMEGWCDKKLENGIPKTIENSSTEGLYRVLLDYSIDGTNRQTITNEFNIIN
jgi:hypothetical protein